MLKTLLTRKKIDKKNIELEELRNQLEEVNKKEAELAEAIDEVNEEISEEDMRAIEEEVEETSTKKAELEAKKEGLEKEIEDLEKEIEEIEEDEEKNEKEEVKPAERAEVKTIETREVVNMNNLTTREAIKRRLENEEVRSFYSTIADVMLKRASIENASLLVPTDVVNAIHTRMEDYGTVHKLVKKVNLNGAARVIVNSGEIALFWTEKCASLEEVTLPTLNAIELDNYKLGGYVFLCNATIEDSSIDLAAWIEDEFAKAIAGALDDAILNGQGASEKQPEGILTTVTDVTEVADLAGALALGAIDTDSEVIYLMNNATYIKNVATKFINTDSQGRTVLGINKVMPNGLKIVLSSKVPADEFIVGAFNPGYVLGVRKEARFDTNDRLKWVEEQTGFKVSGRYDGKVADATLFARGKFAAETPGV